MLSRLFGSCRCCKKNRHRLPPIEAIFDLVQKVYRSRFNQNQLGFEEHLYEDLNNLQFIINTIDKNNPEEVHLLRETDKVGWTLFHRIVQAELIASKFNPRGSKRLNRNNLIQTCLRIDPSLINLKTADSTETSALHLAAMQNHTDAYNILLAYGADSSLRDKHGRAPGERLSTSSRFRQSFGSD